MMWEPYRKTRYCIHYEIVQPGTETYNKLESCDYVSTEEQNVKLIGLLGEEWLTGEEQLCSTYDCYDNGEAWTIPNGNIVWMRPAQGQEQIVTSWGNVLTANLDENSRGELIDHGYGDMVACADDGGYPDENHQWIVNGRIFELTYERVC